MLAWPSRLSYVFIIQCRFVSVGMWVRRRAVVSVSLAVSHCAVSLSVHCTDITSHSEDCQALRGVWHYILNTRGQPRYVWYGMVWHSAPISDRPLCFCILEWIIGPLRDMRLQIASGPVFDCSVSLSLIPLHAFTESVPVFDPCVSLSYFTCVYR